MIALLQAVPPCGPSGEVQLPCVHDAAVCAGFEIAITSLTISLAAIPTDFIVIAENQ